jgi:hypothetical protein
VTIQAALVKLLVYFGSLRLRHKPVSPGMPSLDANGAEHVS